MIYRDQLEAVRKLIERPEAWCKGSWGMTATGVHCKPQADDAVRWCLSGACTKIGIPFDGRGLAFFGDESKFLMDFNDIPERTHAEVLALLDSAIQRAPVRERIAPNIDHDDPSEVTP